MLLGQIPFKLHPTAAHKKKKELKNLEKLRFLPELTWPNE